MCKKRPCWRPKRAIVTVEEIVDDLNTGMNAVLLPKWVISAVCEVPGGAHPSYAHGYYKRDNAFYKAWDAISRDRDTFLDWMDTYVLETADFSEFQQKLKEAANA